MDEQPHAKELEIAVQEALVARRFLFKVFNMLYSRRSEESDARESTMLAFLKKDEEKLRTSFDEWLKTAESFNGTMGEKASLFIVSVLHIPSLHVLARECVAELKDTSKWETATAFVNAWFHVKEALQARFDEMPEGQVKDHMRPMIASVVQTFATSLPPKRSQH